MNEIQFQHILDVEGRKYTNHPLDKGGPTKYGITLKALEAHRGVKVTASDVEKLTEREAREIYEKRYEAPMRLDFFQSPKVQLAVLDQGVNRGIGTGMRMAQMTANSMGAKLTVDGKNGPKTSAAINAIDPEAFSREFIQLAQHGYLDIVQRKPDQMVFMRGWLNRTHILQDRLWAPSKPLGEAIIVPKPDLSIVAPSTFNALAPYNLARKEIGVKELPGKAHEARIIYYHGFTTLKATTDEIAWCSSFVCAMLELAGFTSSRSAAARSYLTYGEKGDGSVGDIVVFWRGTPNGWQGHVGFVAKKYKKGDKYISVLGGNQSNQVKESNYLASQLLDFRRPGKAQFVGKKVAMVGNQEGLFLEVA